MHTRRSIIIILAFVDMIVLMELFLPFIFPCETSRAFFCILGSKSSQPSKSEGFVIRKHEVGEGGGERGELLRI